MTYEHERGIIGMLGGIEDRHLIDLSDYKKELKEVYAKAKAFNEIEKHLKEIHNEFKGNINEIHRLLGQETEFIIEDMEDK